MFTISFCPSITGTGAIFDYGNIAPVPVSGPGQDFRSPGQGGSQFLLAFRVFLRETPTETGKKVEELKENMSDNVRRILELLLPDEPVDIRLTAGQLELPLGMQKLSSISCHNHLFF